MFLRPTTEQDIPEIVALANLAYRQASTWATEAGVIAGTRLTEPQLRDDLASKPGAHLLLYREAADGTLLGTVWLEPKSEAIWYLGLLIIHPDLQNQRLGQRLLAAAEAFVQQQGGRRIRMTVLAVRDTLIAWYERRGYARTGESQPFPYGDERFGKPLRDDLSFIVLEKRIA
jgi:ribosomal protein S18 acetylase RimI-like enzyme